MPKYSYQAKSFQGEEKSGVLEAKDESQLAKTLRDQGFLLVKAEKQKEEKEAEPGRGISLPFFNRVPLTEKMMFTRNLEVMIASGLPLPRALETLSLQAGSQKFKKALLEIKDQVVKGEAFSECLKEYPDIFSELFQSMIKVGEETGTLENVLKVLTRQMEREHDLRSKIQGALMYPAIIVLAMIGIGILMLVMVVPKLAATFEELQIELPLTTKLVIGLGTFLAEKWYLAIIIILFLVFAFWRVLQFKWAKRILDSLFLRLPIVSGLVRKINSAYMARNLSSLISAGVALVRSLEITAGTMGNSHFKESLLNSTEKVRKGEKFSDVLESYKSLYPSIVFQMIRVGEETGETSNVLAKLADFFEEEVGSVTKNLASVIEPILMIVIGGIVGFFAISMVQPMYSMLGAI